MDLRLEDGGSVGGEVIISGRDKSRCRQGGRTQVSEARMVDWCNLHSDMLILVAKCVKGVLDHLAFAAVCSSWRSAALEVRPSFARPVPGLMLSGSKSRLFFSIYERRCYKKKINLVDDGDTCLGSHGGWLFIVHKNLDISLFNPFSRERLCLPPVTSFPYPGEAQFALDNTYYVRTAALSCQNINVKPEDATVMVVEGGFRRLAFAKPGDSSWRVIEDDPARHFSGILFYCGQFYAVGPDAAVVCNIGPNPKSTSLAPLPQQHSSFESKRYLVELMGELVLVERLLDCYNDDPYDFTKVYEADEFDNYETDNVGFDVEELGTRPAVDKLSWYRTMSFRLYKMDFAKSQWIPIHDLGNQVIFVGFNSAFSMPCWDQGEAHCIYFTDDNELAFLPPNRESGNYGYDMGVFDVKNGMVKHHIGEKKKLFPPPMWVNYIPW